MPQLENDPQASPPEELPPVFAGLPAMPQPFYGRDHVLEELLGLLQGDGVQAVAISGPGGMGKTALASTLARHPACLNRFEHGVLWAGLGLQADPHRVLAAWGAALGKDITRQAGMADRAQAVRRLIGARRMLLVIDDAGDFDQARALQCGGPNCSHLLTSREAEVARQFAGPRRALALQPLEAEAALELLAALAPEACQVAPDSAAELAAACRGLPLALELLGGYLAAPDLEAADRLREIPRRAEAAAGQLSLHTGSSLSETLRLSLGSLPEEARRAFSELGAFAPEPDRFSHQAALTVTGASPESLQLLVARRLLHSSGAGLAVPFALADAACAHTSPAALARHREYYLAYAQACRNDLHCLEQVYAQVKWAWAGAPDDTDLLKWIEALSQYQQRSGQWRDYVDWAERGLRFAIQSDRPHEQGLLYNNLAKVYSDLGQRERAVSYYQQALPILEQAGERAELATALSNLGTAFAGLGKKERAMVYYHRALPMLEEAGNQYALATTLNNLGKLHIDLGERAQALFYYRRALPLLVDLGDLAVESTARFNLALLYKAQGRLAEAVAELRRAIALEGMIGHPDLESDSALLAQLERQLAAPRLLRWLRKLI